jgi:hypothetical protein
MKTMGWVILGVVALGTGPGCISSHQTVYEDAPRARVEFENETAAKLFYERLSRLTASETSESRSAVSIPVVLDVSRTRRRSYNSVFNEAVARCDTNQDSRVTELEARIFAEQP